MANWFQGSSQTKSDSKTSVEWHQHKDFATSPRKGNQWYSFGARPGWELASKWLVDELSLKKQQDATSTWAHHSRGGKSRWAADVGEGLGMPIHSIANWLWGHETSPRWESKSLSLCLR